MRRFCSALLGLLLVAASLQLWAAKPKQKLILAADAKPGDIHDPANAVANLEVHKELQATLFASEPMITNPTNLDIDARGRVWICDVVNYRGNNGKRPEGDRILILEDTDGDGKADKVKTFYQGRDVDSAMGICVLGKKVIVSCSPNILVFTDEDGDDKPEKKEVLFTKTGQPQHDHSAHSFLFGPDGKLYWNVGNTGKSVHDKQGNLIVDLAGNKVEDNGKPYFGGMPFRCNLDGSAFEVLAHNFRNNYEVTVDSFGTLWQSDNDDDGNRGVRINYVMEYGNFGYRDEVTGAGWQSKRTNMEDEIPLRHWHLNDPGVVPNLVQTGQGSPTGICLYEGTLLPKIFHNQIIHCDAGPSIVRSYPATPDGAGYKVPEIVNILDGQKKNNWFRPADVCVAPDGSLFVTDWYDPGVGGHGQRDIERGRIFRVAPPGVKYTVPKTDLSTTAGQLTALKSPNLALRYLAWTALHADAKKAEPELLKLYQSDEPAHLRARAIWLLGKLPGKGQDAVTLGLKDANENLRIVGLRLARQLSLDLAPILAKLVDDTSPAVRRECALALRHYTGSNGAELWTKLAQKHDGKDRWYLEALGLGADRQWDAYLATYLKANDNKLANKPARDVVWRSRAKQTTELLGKVLLDTSTPTDEVLRTFRALDFQPASDSKETVLAQLAFSPTGDLARQTLLATEAIVRIKNFDVKQTPKNLAAVNAVLENAKGTLLFVEVVGKLNLTDRFGDLLSLAQKQPHDQAGVDAMRLLLEKNQVELIRKGFGEKERALATVQALGNAAHENAIGLLVPVLQDTKAETELRRQATRALAKSQKGAAQLVGLAERKQLAPELTGAAGLALSSIPWRAIKDRADKLFPQPELKDKTPLPAISELVKRKGDTAKGLKLFAEVGKCANCHLVNGAGKEVGPDLSEIAKKLSKEALYESILFPSASIAHNYEQYLVETKKGVTVQGILVSETPQEVTLKLETALVQVLKKPEIDTMKKLSVSIMPADLNKVLAAQDVTDIVEYMLTLKEAKKAK